MPRTLAPCPSTGAYQRHRRLGEPIDQPCRDAWSAYNRALWHAKRSRAAQEAQEARAATDRAARRGPTTPTPLAVVGAVDRCRLDIPEAAALLEISVDRCRSLLAEGRAQERAR